MLAISNKQYLPKHVLQCPAINLRKMKSPVRILLVEDMPFIQLTVATVLKEKLKCHVDIANTGEKAVEIFPRGYDLVLMDIDLPGIDGFDATRQIRKCNPNQNTQIIAHTNKDENEVKEECINSGMQGFIKKGASLLELCDSVERALCALG